MTITKTTAFFRNNAQTINTLFENEAQEVPLRETARELGLTERESRAQMEYAREVVMEGYSRKQPLERIADKLGLARDTVDYIIATSEPPRVMGLTGKADTSDAALYDIRAYKKPTNSGAHLI
jgi:hypothetical protein